MSEAFLVVIPADPKAALPKTAEKLRDALALIAGTDEARVKDYGKLQFIDAGENAGAIRCPACGADIGPQVWKSWMESDWHGADGFHLHRHAAPCCGQETHLNDLTYYPAQGFAYWFVSARNPGRGALSDIERRRLEVVAGLQLKAIAQSY